MTLAETLRNEMNVERELPWLRENVLSSIRSRGRWSVICDTHISKNTKGWAVMNKYYTPICEWAEKEGLKARSTYNGHGVRHIEITL